MDELWTRIAENMMARVSGPLRARLVLQPAMAAIFAILDGLKDAKAGKPAYFWALLNSAEHRAELLASGWRSVGKIFVLALALDVVFQVMVLRTVYPGEALAVAFQLAITPYLLLRGPVSRLARKR